MDQSKTRNSDERRLLVRRLAREQEAAEVLQMQEPGAEYSNTLWTTAIGHEDA